MKNSNNILKGVTNPCMDNDDLQSLAGDAYKLSQTHGMQETNERYRWYTDNGVSLTVASIEEWISDEEEIIGPLEAQLAIKERFLLQARKEGIPEYVLLDDIQTRDKLEKQLKYHKERWRLLTEDLDKSLTVAEEETPDHIPFHWMEAKEYWERIFTYITQNDVKKNHLLRLQKKVSEANRKKSISSWYYFNIAFHIALKTDNRSEANKLINYAAACKKNAAAKGWSWKPSETKSVEIITNLNIEDVFSDKVTISEDMDNPFYNDPDEIYYGKIEPNNFLREHQLSENELIDAIDARAGRRVINY